MTDLRKAAEMALEVLETTWGDGSEDALKEWKEATQALHHALAEPKREWVGLTSDETWEIFTHYDPLQYSAFSRAIEAKLKEKNA